MSNKTFFTSLIFITILFSCSSTKILSDYDDSVNFKNYKTYNFSNETDNLPIDDIIKNRLINSISSNLNNKGFVKSENPDFLVDLDVKTKNKKDYSNTNVNVSTTFGKRWRFRTGVGKTFSKEINYTEGTLLINIIDNDKKQLIWKGSGTDVVKDKNLNNSSISEAINKILSGFPPR